MAGEERVLACQSQTTDRTLDRVAVDLDAPIVEEADEPVPVVETIAEGGDKLRAL